jgi:NAD(P)-dependent dehydrogenase (short-subunit alcohol dehydrogenase family)
VVGAGQTPGDTIGNGRATALLFAREGARVVASIAGSIPPRRRSR